MKTPYEQYVKHTIERQRKNEGTLAVIAKTVSRSDTALAYWIVAVGDKYAVVSNDEHGGSGTYKLYDTFSQAHDAHFKLCKSRNLAIVPMPGYELIMLNVYKSAADTLTLTDFAKLLCMPTLQQFDLMINKELLRRNMSHVRSTSQYVADATMQWHMVIRDAAFIIATTLSLEFVHCLVAVELNGKVTFTEGYRTYQAYHDIYDNKEVDRLVRLYNVSIRTPYALIKTYVGEHPPGLHIERWCDQLILVSEHRKKPI